MYVCILHVCLAPAEARRWSQTPGTGVTDVVSTMWVLGIDLSPQAEQLSQLPGSLGPPFKKEIIFNLLKI